MKWVKVVNKNKKFIKQKLIVNHIKIAEQENEECRKIVKDISTAIEESISVISVYHCLR